MLSSEEAADVAEKLFTLGDFAYLLRAMKRRGWTSDSVRYTVDHVFWEDDNDRPE